QLSDPQAQMSEPSDTHMRNRNQIGTNTEPVRETRARKVFSSGDISGNNSKNARPAGVDDSSDPNGSLLKDPAVAYWWDTCQQRRRDPAYPHKEKLPQSPQALPTGLAERFAGKCIDLS